MFPYIISVHAILKNKKILDPLHIRACSDDLKALAGLILAGLISPPVRQGRSSRTAYSHARSTQNRTTSALPSAWTPLGLGAAASPPSGLPRSAAARLVGPSPTASASGLPPARARPHPRLRTASTTPRPGPPPRRLQLASAEPAARHRRPPWPLGEFASTRRSARPRLRAAGPSDALSRSGPDRTDLNLTGARRSSRLLIPSSPSGPALRRRRKRASSRIRTGSSVALVRKP